MSLHHAASGELIQIHPLHEKLTESISTALVKSSQLEIMRLILLAGKTVPEHQVPGEITLQCIEGAVKLHVQKREQILHSGEMIFLSGNVPYELHALENSSMLMTIVLKHNEENMTALNQGQN